MKRRLGIEGLEERQVMDASWEFAAMDDPSQGITAGDLVITGSDFNDRITVMGIKKFPGDVRVLSDNRVLISQETIPAGSKIVFLGGDGNDRFTVSGKLVESDETTPIELVVLGGDGNDYMAGAAGNDILIGGDGNDTMVGGAGDDYLGQAFDGDDAITGMDPDDGLGNDKIDAGAGNDILNGGDGNDSLSAGAGDDILRGGASTDTLNAGMGNDMLLGGEGNDRLNGDRGLDILVGGEGKDNLSGGDDEDLLIAGAITNEAIDNDTALSDFMSAWTGSPDALPSGMRTAGDDGEQDNVVGGRGTDVLYASLFLPPAMDPLLYDICKPVAKEFETVEAE